VLYRRPFSGVSVRKPLHVLAVPLGLASVWLRVRWRHFLAWAVIREGGVIYRAQVTTDVRAALAQAIPQVRRFEGPPRVLKGKLVEVLTRTLEAWDAACQWHPENTMTAFDRKVGAALVREGSGE
jgi:hypothetical protein